MRFSRDQEFVENRLATGSADRIDYSIEKVKLIAEMVGAINDSTNIRVLNRTETGIYNNVVGLALIDLATSENIGLSLSLDTLSKEAYLTEKKSSPFANSLTPHASDGSGFGQNSRNPRELEFDFVPDKPAIIAVSLLRDKLDGTDETEIYINEYEALCLVCIKNNLVFRISIKYHHPILRRRYEAAYEFWGIKLKKPDSNYVGVDPV